MNIYDLQLNVNNRIFRGDTVFSILISDNGRFKKIYIKDLLVKNGNLTRGSRLQDRLYDINNFFKNDYNYDPFMNPCYMTIFPYFTLNNLEFLNESGMLYFYPDNSRNNTYSYKYTHEEEEKTLEEYGNKTYIVRKHE